MPDGVRINLDGEDGNVLIRRQGEALAALQHIVAAIYRHEASEGRRLVVDCMGYRKGKDDELRQMARSWRTRPKTAASRRRSVRSIRTNAASSTWPLPKSKGDVGKHRRRVREDGHHFGQVIGQSRVQRFEVKTRHAL